jgi:hypothetical protein
MAMLFVGDAISIILSDLIIAALLMSALSVVTSHPQDEIISCH